MLVDLNHAQASVIVLIENRLNARGFSGAAVSKEKHVVCLSPLDEGLRIFHQLFLLPLIAHQISEVHMLHAGDGLYCHIAFLPGDAECLVESEFSHAEFPVKFSGPASKFLIASGLSQSLGEFHNPAADTAVETAAFLGAAAVAANHCPQAKILSLFASLVKEPQIIGKQPSEYSKIVKCQFTQASFCLPPDFTCHTVGIFVNGQAESQKTVPQVSLKPVRISQLNQASCTPGGLLCESFSSLFLQKAAHPLEQLSVF